MAGQRAEDWARGRTAPTTAPAPVRRKAVVRESRSVTSDLLHLQSSAGNHAVVGMLNRQADPKIRRDPAATLTPDDAAKDAKASGAADKPLTAPSAAKDNKSDAKYASTRTRDAAYGDEFTEGSHELSNIVTGYGKIFEHQKGQHKVLDPTCPHCAPLIEKANQEALAAKLAAMSAAKPAAGGAPADDQPKLYGGYSGGDAPAGAVATPTALPTTAAKGSAYDPNAVLTPATEKPAAGSAYDSNAVLTPATEKPAAGSAYDSNAVLTPAASGPAGASGQPGAYGAYTVSDLPASADKGSAYAADLGGGGKASKPAEAATSGAYAASLTSGGPTSATPATPSPYAASLAPETPGPEKAAPVEKAGAYAASLTDAPKKGAAASGSAYDPNAVLTPGPASGSAYDPNVVLTPGPASGSAYDPNAALTPATPDAKGAGPSDKKEGYSGYVAGGDLAGPDAKPDAKADAKPGEGGIYGGYVSGGDLPAQLSDAQSEVLSAPDPAAAAEAKEKRDFVADKLKTQFGWSEEDCAKYLDKVKNIGSASAAPGDKPVVTNLDEAGREAYAVAGSGSFTRGGAAFDTGSDYSKFMGGSWAIFVMSKDGQLYAGSHKVGLFHHSSFLSGGEVAGAGEMKASGGRITALTNKSGHYKPTGAEMMQVFAELQSRGVNLASVDYFHIGKNFHGAPTPAEGGAKAAYEYFKTDPNGTPPAKGAKPADAPAAVS
jgi:hypothetical protein